MPRSENLTRYDDTLKDLMDAVGGGGAPIRLKFDTARIAAGKRAQFYAMTRALEKACDNEKEPMAQKLLNTRLKSWYKVKLKVVREGTEDAIVKGDKEWDSPAELLVINMNHTKEAIEMAKLIRKSIGEQNPSLLPSFDAMREASTGLPSDRSHDVLSGALSIADMVQDLDTNAEKITRIVEVDPVTGYQKTDDGRVLNRYGVFVAYADSPSEASADTSAKGESADTGGAK